MWHTVCVCVCLLALSAHFYNWNECVSVFFVLKLLADNFSGTWPSLNTQYKYSIFVSFSIENKENKLYDFVSVSVSLQTFVLKWSMKVACCSVLFCLFGIKWAYWPHISLFLHIFVYLQFVCKCITTFHFIALHLIFAQFIASLASAGTTVGCILSGLLVSVNKCTLDEIMNWSRK